MADVPPYDDAPDLQARFEAEAATRWVRAVGLFLLMSIAAGAEAGFAFVYRDPLFALISGLAAACFAFLARRVWGALS